MTYYFARYILLLVKTSSSFKLYIILPFFILISCVGIFKTSQLTMLLFKSFNFADLISFLIVQLSLFFSVGACYVIIKMKVIAYNTKIESVKEFLQKNAVNKDVIFFNFFSDNLEENYCELVVIKGSKAQELLESTNIDFVKKWKAKSLS
jgi:hypothetical protein